MPPHTAKVPWPLLVTVSLLYAAEGAPFGVIHELVPVYLKTQGSSLEALGLVGLVGLPWTFKALWAPAVDRWGRTGHWVSAALLTAATLTLLVPWLGTGPILWVVLVGIAAASATQDVAIDGFTTATVPEAQMGRVNGIRVGAYRVAMLAAGGGAVALAGFVDWTVVFALVGLALVPLAIWAWRLPAPPRSETPPSIWGFVGALWAWLTRDGVLAGGAVLVFVLLFKVGDSAMGPMVKPFWLDAGLSLGDVGLISITLGTLLSIGGALIGGELTSRMGIFRALWVLGALQAVSNLGYAGAASIMPLDVDPATLVLADKWPVYLASMVESFAGGLGTAAYLAFLMRLCEGKQAATRFALLSAFTGLTRTISGAASGFAAESWGYSPYFAFTFVLALPAFALLPWVQRRLRTAPAPSG